MKSNRALICTLILLTCLAACDLTGRKSTPVIPPPTVAITLPISGYTVHTGEDVSVNSTANDTQGILKAELWVDGSLYRVDVSPDPEGQTTFVTSQPWHAAVPGSHTLVVRAYSQSGQVAESMPVTVNVLASSVAVPTGTPTIVVLVPTDTPIPPTLTNTSVPPTPTDTPTSPPPTATSTLVPEPTDTSVPTVTPMPTGTLVLPAVPEPFAHVWDAVGGAGGSLGNPVAEAVLDRWVADQFFQGGLAYWRNNEFVPANYIYVLFYKDGSDETRGTVWMQFEDSWRNGMPKFACPEADGVLGPVRGFGKVWCEETPVREGLELPVSVELGANAGFQDFENGTMIWLARLGCVYVLYGDGRWQRF